ncbi:MAG: type II secretion system F family protein [Comamonas sp.]
MAISSHTLFVLAGLFILAACVLLLLGQLRRKEQKDHIDTLIEKRQTPLADELMPQQMPWTERLLREPLAWLETSWGQQLVAHEDRALLVQCGYQSHASRAYFLLARLGLAVFLPIAALLILPALESQMQKWMALFFAFALGFMLPKWYVRSKATQRRRQAARELPVLVDLLGLLQGAGLGIDQSLQLVAADFKAVMPVLSGELAMANRLYASGRSREQALLRISEMFQSEEMADLSALIVQIDRHGGAVQEPLRQFGLRLREQRRMRMKEDIGKITVKMTGVMVVTLLPSLLIITAGPGFLSVIRALGRMN